MKRLSIKAVLALIGVLIVVPSLVVFLRRAPQTLKQRKHIPGRATITAVSTATVIPETASSWPVISRNAPAFASSEYYPASNANDDNYDVSWRSLATPAWLAYDLSDVPVSYRGEVLVVWYNPTYDYDHTLNGDKAYNLPQDYTIEVNMAPGGRNPPNSGWVVLATVKGNHYHSREHVIAMRGSNWVRIVVTAVDGAPQNEDVNIKMDIYATNYGVTDNWIFFGDSITAGAMGYPTVDGTKTFAQFISAKVPNHFPAQEAGGIGYLKSSDGAKYINLWLQLFPGRYVVLSYGTNDALGCIDAHVFYQNYAVMVQAVLRAGKIPIVPRMPWGRDANIQDCAPALNAGIDALYRAYPQIMKGPDFWSFFQNHPTLISNDGIHPTYPGFGAYRQLWADAMLEAVYRA